MEEIIQIITTKEFIYFSIGIVISGIIAWYISSHFSIPRIKESKIKQLKTIKQTDFGQNLEYIPIDQKEILEHPHFGKFIIHPNGVVVDDRNQLMWIRAPWGMNWNGKEFVGQPLSLNWLDAANYFGEGPAAGQNPTGTITEKDLINSKSLVNYKQGKATVLFANYENWRLPTAYELNTLGLVSENDENYRSLDIDKPEKFREKLFPGVKAITGNFFWSATKAHSGCVWGVDGGWPLGDMKPDLKRYVLFVRDRGTQG